MKTLEIQGFFALPDNFEGTALDAVKLFATYELDVAAEGSKITSPPECLTRTAIWEAFLDTIKAGKRAAFTTAVHDDTVPVSAKT